jgi:hypothetical protein
MILQADDYNYKDLGIDEVDLPYSSSKKVGESIQWTKDKKPLNLN